MMRGETEIHSMMNRIQCCALAGALMIATVLAATAPVQAQDVEQPGVEGTTYTSPTWGYSLAWTDEWEVIASFADQTAHGVTEGLARGDYLLLSAGLPNGNAVSLEIMAGAGYGGNPVPCLDTYVADLEALQAQSSDEVAIAGFQPATADGQPVGGTDPTSAYGLFEYSMTGEEFHWDLVDYVDCRTLREGAAVLRIEASTLRENYETAVPLIEAVLATLSLPAGGDIASPTPPRPLPPQLDPLPSPAATPAGDD
jgi:hypothetical protein